MLASLGAWRRYLNIGNSPQSMLVYQVPSRPSLATVEPKLRNRIGPKLINRKSRDGGPMTMAARLSLNLKRLFDAYCTYQGLKPSTVGMDAMRDPRLYEKVKSGSGAFTVQTYDKVVAWFAADWPGHLEWPKGINRPVVEPRQPVRRKRRPVIRKINVTLAAIGAVAQALSHFGIETASIVEIGSLFDSLIII